MGREPVVSTVMPRIVRLNTRIPESREVVLQLPVDVPIGAAQIILEVTPEAEHLENQQDIEDARRALAEAEKEGTIGLADLKAELGL